MNTRGGAAAVHAGDIQVVSGGLGGALAVALRLQPATSRGGYGSFFMMHVYCVATFREDAGLKPFNAMHLNDSFSHKHAASSSEQACIPLLKDTAAPHNVCFWHKPRYPRDCAHEHIILNKAEVQTSQIMPPLYSLTHIPCKVLFLMIRL